MRGLPGAVRAVNSDFYVVTRGLKDDGAVLRHPSSELRLRLIQRPGAHLCVARETYRPCYKAQRKREYTCSCFHVPSIANRLWEWITAQILVLAGQFCNLQSSSAILFGIYAGRVDVGYRDVST